MIDSKKIVYFIFLFVVLNGTKVEAQLTIELQASIDSLINLPHSKQYLPFAIYVDSLLLSNDSKVESYEAKRWIGHYHRKANNIEAAIGIYQEAFHLGTGLDDQEMIAESAMYLGVMQANLNNVELAQNYFEQSQEIAERINNTQVLSALENEKGRMYLKNGEFEKALKHSLAAIELANKCSCSINVHHINNNIGVIYAQIGQPLNALVYFQNYLDYFKANKDSIHFSGAYGNIAYALHKAGNFKQAFLKYDTSLYYSKKYDQHETTYITYQDMSDAYAMKGDLENALAYQKKHTNLYKKELNRSTQYRIADLEVEFDIQEKERQIKEDKSKIHSMGQAAKINTQRSIIAILGLISSLIIVALLYMKAKVNGQKKETERKLAQTELKNNMLETKQLKKDLKNQKSDLINLSIDIKRKNEFSASLAEKLNLLRISGKDKFDTLLKEIILTTNNHLQINNDLAILQANVDNINQDFYKKLKEKYPNITPNEKYLCGLLRLGLSNKDIATIKNISIDSAKTSRYRLRKKIDINPKDDIVLLLQSI